MTDPHKEIARITEELRILCDSCNEAPALIIEMMEREFPFALQTKIETLISELE